MTYTEQIIYAQATRNYRKYVARCRERVVRLMSELSEAKDEEAKALMEYEVMLRKVQMLND